MRRDAREIGIVLTHHHFLLVLASGSDLNLEILDAQGRFVTMNTRMPTSRNRVTTMIGIRDITTEAYDSHPISEYASG